MSAIVASPGRAALILRWTVQCVTRLLICAYFVRLLVTAHHIDASLWDRGSWIFYGWVMTALVLLAWLNSATVARLERVGGRRLHQGRRLLGPWAMAGAAVGMLMFGTWSAQLERDVMLWSEPGRDVVGIVTDSTGGHNPGTFGWWQVDGHRYWGDLPYNVYQADARDGRVPFQVSVQDPAVVVTVRDPFIDILGFGVGLVYLLVVIICWACGGDRGAEPDTGPATTPVT